MTIAHELESMGLPDVDLSLQAEVADRALRMEELLLAEPANSEHIPIVGLSVARAALDIYEVYETNLEVESAEQVIAGRSRVDDYPLYERFHRLLSREVELAGIGPDDRTLFIGSGPFPVSAILLHELSGGAKVDCLDQSAEACEISKALLDVVGLDEDIQVFDGSAQEAVLPTVGTPGDFGDYDAVLVALMAQPKPEVLHRLWRSVHPEATIVLRNSEGSRRLLYEGMDPEINTLHHQQIGEYHAGVDDTISGTVLKTAQPPRLYRI